VSVAQRPGQQHREPDAEDQREALAAQHLDHRIELSRPTSMSTNRTDHGAGVDDDLHEAQERRLLGHVEPADESIVIARNSAECTALREHHAQRAEQGGAED
jgi:hypothetical protein